MMKNDCSGYIYPEYISEYQKYHKAICLNLNRLIWNVAFLKTAKHAQENNAHCRNDFVIGHLYQNEFELLIVRLHRTFFDKGSDAMTLPQLKTNLFSKYLLPKPKSILQESLKDVAWDTDEIVVSRRRLESAVPVFRTNYIAHTLTKEADDVSVSWPDSEKVVMAACDLFNHLGYGLESFYSGKEKFYLNFIDEKTSSEMFLDEFFLFQQTSALCIKKLDAQYSSEDSTSIVRENIDKINQLLE